MLDPPTQAAVRSSYEDAIHVTLWFSSIMAVFGLISSVFIKEKALPNKKWYKWKILVPVDSVETCPVYLNLYTRVFETEL